MSTYPSKPEASQPRQAGSVFLPKETYRQRRVLDAVKAWPILGAFLFGLPVMWQVSERSNVVAMIYLFGLWAILIAGAAIISGISRRMRAETQDRLPEVPREPRL